MTRIPFPRAAESLDRLRPVRPAVHRAPQAEHLEHRGRLEGLGEPGCVLVDRRVGDRRHPVEPIGRLAPHVPEDVGFAYDVALEAMRAEGIEEIAVFNGRARTQETLG